MPYLPFDDHARREILSSFSLWTGGFNPSECEPERILIYVDTASPNKYDPYDIKTFLTDCWLSEALEQQHIIKVNY